MCHLYIVLRRIHYTGSRHISFDMISLFMKARILLSIIIFSLIGISCSSSPKFNIAEIEQGKWLDFSQKGHTGHYFNIFSKANKLKTKYWNTLYKDDFNIYYGFIEPKSIISKTQIAKNIYRISIEEMENNIPFYTHPNINSLLLEKINNYFDKIGNNYFKTDIISGTDILRNDEILYQVEAICYWMHFEAGKRNNKLLIIMDKNLNILETFIIYGL